MRTLTQAVIGVLLLACVAVSEAILPLVAWHGLGMLVLWSPPE